MESWKLVSLAACIAGALVLNGCAPVAGVAGGAAGYEYSNKRALDELDEDFKAGRISREEYLERKADIEERSAVE